jgi:hypothetical protein
LRAANKCDVIWVGVSMLEERWGIVAGVVTLLGDSRKEPSERDVVGGEGGLFCRNWQTKKRKGSAILVVS